MVCRTTTLYSSFSLGKEVVFMLVSFPYFLTLLCLESSLQSITYSESESTTFFLTVIHLVPKIPIPRMS